jgi:hypothetical protein
VTDPETKRKLIGNEFIKVFQHATEELLEEDQRNVERKLATEVRLGAGHGGLQISWHRELFILM